MALDPLHLGIGLLIIVKEELPHLCPQAVHDAATEDELLDADAV